MGKNAKLKERQKWSHEKLHLDNARKLPGIYFIDPEDKEFKETIKNARKKLETPIAFAMLCKILKNKKNCGSGTSQKVKSKLACILEASESTRLRLGELLPTHHEDHIAGKGDNSLQYYILVLRAVLTSVRRPWVAQPRPHARAGDTQTSGTMSEQHGWRPNSLVAEQGCRSPRQVHKFIPMPQAMKIPAAKEAVDKEWEKLEKMSAWNLTKVRINKEVIDAARTKGAKVHFVSVMDICHLKNAELEAKHQKYRGRVVL